MIEKRNALVGGMHYRNVVLTPSETENTMTFTLISEDNSGMRYDWMSGDSYEELLDVNGANTDRLGTFFKDHDRSVDSAIGKVTNTRVEGTALVGDVTFGTDDASQAIHRKYTEGILTDVSVGYEINTYSVEEREGQPDLVTVTDYSIFELSSVGVGFDAGAKKRNKEGDNTMAVKDTTPEVATRDFEAELAEKRDAEVRLKAENDAMIKENLELKRQAEVRSIGTENKASVELVERALADSGITIEKFLREVLAEIEAATKVTVIGVPDEAEMKRELSNAVTVKLGGTADLVGNEFRGASLLDLGRKLTGYNGFDRLELAQRMMVSTDFPKLLIESGNRVLEQEWEGQNLTYKAWVKEVDLPDFRINTDITAPNAGGRLDKITEGGELQEKYLGEHFEQWKLSSYGNKFVLTREMLINDDLGAFNNMLSNLIEMAGVTANGNVYDLLTGKGEYAGYTMQDGVAIFNAAHGNNTATTVLSPDALRQGRLTMRKQLSLNGETPLNLAPTYLICAPELEQAALEILNSTASLESEKNAGVVNTEYKMVMPIIDAELTSATEWYLASSTRTIKAGYLSGTGRRPLLQTDSSSLTRTAFEGVFDFGVMAEAYQGLYKGNG